MSTSRPARTRATSRRPPTVDAYLEALDEDRRALLARLRRTLRAALPGAVECFSYGMPAFRVGGRVVAGFQATAHGGSFYPFSGSTLDGLGDALAGFGRTKSALHFTTDRPLPAALVRRLVRARIAERSPPSSRRTAAAQVGRAPRQERRRPPRPRAGALPGR